MNDFESAFKKVSELVDDFKQNEKKYLSPAYQEAEVRRDFIDKFFEALGWDVYHNTQKNPYEQEVKVERHVNVGKAQKRADYAFYIAPEYRDPKFFTEAKKPNRNLKNADDYFQTIRYGWNANTPVAVLTDFEEFHILDCRFKPNIDSVLQNQNHKNYKYSDYADSDKFKEIYYLFSRDAVADGSLQKYSDSLPKPKGKATQWGMFKGIVKPIDEDFLEYIDEVRETLAKAFKKNDLSLTSEQLTEVTQKTVDRLVFIRFLEDKLIEPEYYISELGNKGNIWKEFISLCKKLDAKYNGIVFKETSIDKQNFQGPEQIEFRKICKDISHLNSPYDFHYIPIHILGSIYERFLGKIVKLKGRGVVVEEKPEVRKAGGVYYTPKYIVDYIVKNTVGKLIENKTPEEISKLRFADIACGSGSFLIGVYELLLEYHKTYYQKNPKKAEKDGCININRIMTLSLKQKQDILLNNIYGVDIDHQAVEVTQLSLALKMLEDETTFTTRQMGLEFHKKIIPVGLGKNIVCGNSLIGTDILSGTMFAGDEERKLNPMDFETMFPHIFPKKTNNFSESDSPGSVIPAKAGIQSQCGFDAIVGNPPYVNLVAIPESERKYFQNCFKTCKNKSDLYSFFLERAISLLKNNKFRLGYITPHTWLATESFELLRKLLLNNKYINSISEMGFNVFKDAIVSTVVLICSEKNENININNKDFSLKYKLDTQSIVNDNYYIDLDWSMNKEKIYNILKINTVPLEKILKFSRGIKTSNDKKFIGLIQKNEEHKKIYRGKNIKSYQLNWDGEFVWYRPDLMREKTGSLPHSKKFFEVEEKLITQRVNSSMQLLVAYDNQMQYFLDTTNVSRYDSWDKIHSFKYILAILNSSLINYWYCNKYKMPTIGGYELHSIPFRYINFNNESEKHSHDKIVQLVDQMLEAKKKLQKPETDKDKTYYERKCESLDQQIDSEVYKLYGLTDEEIKIVEGKE